MINIDSSQDFIDSFKIKYNSSFLQTRIAKKISQSKTFQKLGFKLPINLEQSFNPYNQSLLVSQRAGLETDRHS